MSEVTRILQAIDQGDPAAAGELLPLVYTELRRLAGARISREAPGHTLQSTALVHEAYLRLVGDNGDSTPWNGRAHFCGAAAEAMRRILVEQARAKKAVKRGGDRKREDLANNIPIDPDRPDEILALNEALEKLKAEEPITARLVELRFFVGLTGKEAAAILDISPRKADKLWLYARVWLKNQISE